MSMRELDEIALPTLGRDSPPLLLMSKEGFRPDSDLWITVMRSIAKIMTMEIYATIQAAIASIYDLDVFVAVVVKRDYARPGADAARGRTPFLEDFLSGLGTMVKRFVEEAGKKVLNV